MRTISLLTIHLGSNFGSILQTIASVKVFENLNCSVTVVNYIPERCTWKRFFRVNGKSLVGMIKLLVGLPIVAINKHVYNSYLHKFVHVSQPIYKKDDFLKTCPVADFYVTGSDQVWNSTYNEGIDGHYFFDGFPLGTVKISYSSSIGKVELDRYEYKEVRRMLGDYKAISVREKSAQKLIESMGYKVTHLLDPTFMLAKEDWKYYMSKRLMKCPYLLVYLPYNVHNKRLIYQSVRRIAQAKGLKVVAFSWDIRPERLADKTAYFANPGDFLSWMYYADCIVTNSFHGTAFSVNLNKQFWVYMPTGFGTRIKSILDLCNLQCRMLQADEVIGDVEIGQRINFDLVNSILAVERQKTYDFLSEVLEKS